MRALDEPEAASAAAQAQQLLRGVTRRCRRSPRAGEQEGPHKPPPPVAVSHRALHPQQWAVFTHTGKTGV